MRFYTSSSPRLLTFPLARVYQHTATKRDGGEERDSDTRDDEIIWEQAVGLLPASGFIAGDQVIHALIFEQSTLKKPGEIPLGPVQDAEPEPITLVEAFASLHAHV